ncbi:hypothetical protein BSL82_03925 [Tardibacter chloracetimidivorans]|uniref:DNA-directed RNA polymerase n=1 Tax=Tardibacter chloracetimidivorans TaxID=1921510 RepID=A0A1L3ZSG7_9SPHN|nr:DNA-directed RNA polymerase [Tardibacter chloracetimidivorans]API58565.1 hypothetical protein BSL82_03925 [Tardibacter chloracetimidivorans]
MYLDDTRDVEFSLEDAALSLGAERYREAQERKAKREGFEKTDAVAKLIKGAIPLVAAGLRKWMEQAAVAKGRKSVAFKPLQLLDADLVAYVSLSRTFHHIAKGGNLQDICEDIGNNIMVELEGRAIMEKDKKAAKRYLALAEGEAKETANARRHGKIAEALGVQLKWPRDRKALTGGAVLGVLLIELKDIFLQVSIHPDKPKVVQLTEEAAELLNSMVDAAAWLRPLHQPMLTSPRPWVSFHTGCYEDVRLSKTVPLAKVKSSAHRQAISKAITEGKMDIVLEALNAIQETHYAIDTRVLEAVLWTRSVGARPSPSFPASSLPEMPPRASDEAWAAMTKRERIALARQHQNLRNIRQAAGVEGAVFAVDMDTAQFLAEQGGFYIPHNLDWRSRVYAVPYFNFQRADHMKALFQFAEGVPLGANGGDWLMIHLANCGDFGKASKKPFAERIAWVREHELEVLMYARDPQGTFLDDSELGGWSKADSPFCFLQACFEYDAWMQSGFSQDFVSHIPIAADGSCSGLQHYSAITRSYEEAHHVNLVPRDTVGDIYQLTAEAALPTLKIAADNGDVYAQRILEVGFGRSDVKRNVMTYFYGSGKFGMRDQHMKDTMQPLADEVALRKREQHPYEFDVQRTDKDTGEISLQADGGFNCAQVLAAHTYQAVVSVAPKADEAASWVQAVAAILAHESLSLTWTSPTGMPIIQRYSEYTSKVVNTWLYDRKVLVPTSTDKVDAAGNVLTRVTMLVREAPTKRINKKKMRSASSPNVIHSMDAAHLQLSVVRAKEQGIRHFAMIHDSFGTHAGNMDLFGRVIREAFIEMYEGYCPLQEIDRHARSVLSDEGIEKLPPIPTKGDLELSLIRQSLYAFA